MNKAATFRLYFNESLSNLDLDNNNSKSFNTYNTALKLNTIEVHISGAPAVYTKV